jgi:hypothetical protein
MSSKSIPAIPQKKTIHVVKVKVYKKDNGFHEGISRCLSQMITYPFESHKINLQVHGFSNQKFRTHGIFQSSFSSGMVFTLYFGIYNSLYGNPLASTVASVITSFVKIPVANCMRLLLLHKNNTNMIACANTIISTKGFLGLYSGLGVNIVEDVIEHNIRNNIYELGRHNIDNPFLNTTIGCIGAALSAGVTTPFDTIKSNFVNETTKPNAIRTTVNIFKQNGIKGLYRGCTVRTLSTGTRFGMFYLILEAIDIIAKAF